LIFKRKATELSDDELVALYKIKSDKELVGVLFKRYTGFIFAVCLKHLRNREESEDAVMQIFEKLFADLHKHNITHFKSWLYTVAKNHCLHIIRNRKKEINSSNFQLPIVETSINLYHDNEDVLEPRMEALERELCNLVHEQRVCIELFYIKEKSYQEVASITGYSLNQVKSYIQNGKRNLKIILSGYEE
jgi:RNA polymerase sigma-70 factor (ECF subfamily)